MLDRGVLLPQAKCDDTIVLRLALAWSSRSTKAPSSASRQALAVLEVAPPQRGLGLGDVKLIAMVGAFLGLRGALVVFAHQLTTEG